MDKIGNSAFPLIDIAPDPIFLIDVETGRIRETNEAAAALLGYELSEIEDMHVRSLHPSDEEYRDLLQLTVEEGTVRRETLGNGKQIQLLSKGGEQIPVELHARALDLDGDPVIYTITRNISDRKEREAALQRQRDRFEDFAEIVSHDIRNPLNVAQARLELLSEEVESEHLGNIEDSLDRIEELIQDTLAIARQGRVAVDLEPIALPDMFTECWRTIETTDAEFEIADENDLEIVADRARLRQLLENLIRNAIDHSDGGVTIRLGAHESGFYIEDDGPGIPESDRSDVFEAGYTTADGGTGFGLAIVKEIADDHGWNIEVGQSDLGGALFDIYGVERPV
jgi:PAS domain S-box-containing protein